MNENLIPFINDDMRYGFVDSNNIIKIPCIYEYAMFFSLGFAGVRNCDNHLMGFVDASNNVVIDFEYDYVIPFFSNITWVCKSGLWGVISMSGDILIDFKYKKASSFKNGVAIVQNIDDKWGLIDIDDNVILDFNYDWLYSKDNIEIDALINGNWIRINKYGCILQNKILKLYKNDRNSN